MSKFPEWYLFLRSEFRPTGERINRLEALRAKYEIPPEPFAYSLSSQPGAGRILQINLYYSPYSYRYEYRPGGPVV